MTEPAANGNSEPRRSVPTLPDVGHHGPPPCSVAVRQTMLQRASTSEITSAKGGNSFTMGSVSLGTDTDEPCPDVEDNDRGAGDSGGVSTT